MTRFDPAVVPRFTKHWTEERIFTPTFPVPESRIAAAQEEKIDTEIGFAALSFLTAVLCTRIATPVRDFPTML